MLKDLLNRKHISTSAEQSVKKHLTTAELRKISELDTSKREKRLRATTSKLKHDFRDFAHVEKLGVYGKAKYLKEVQAALEESGLEQDLISFVLNSMLR